MFTSTSNTEPTEGGAADVLIPLIRTVATIGFAVAPCSLGFVIIAVSEQLIRSIMVGDDPEMLMSDLQNQFPHHAIELNENDDAGLVAKVVDLIECRYTFLAEQIGAPNAVRAVAQACAANPLAVAIPSHRAVCAGGDLAGYRWGIERKRALPEFEAK
jgi:AraC family transcriptional regulator of adaptative response/methylated-DNA-[protein]-cysteine methyltransferase